MAVTETLANHMLDAARPYPVEEHGKLRFICATIVQGAAAGDDGSSVVIGDLPPGRVRILPHLSRYKVTALGASRVMKVGHDLYLDRGEVSDAGEAADDDAFMAAIAVSGATDAAFPATAGTFYDMYSLKGIRLRATITGGTIPAAAVFEFAVAYLYE